MVIITAVYTTLLYFLMTLAAFSTLFTIIVDCTTYIGLKSSAYIVRVLVY